MPVVFDLLRGEALIGRLRIPIVDAGTHGEISTGGAVLRPLAFGERTQIVSRASLTSDPVEGVVSGITRAATVLTEQAAAAVTRAAEASTAQTGAALTGASQPGGSPSPAEVAAPAERGLVELLALALAGADREGPAFSEATYELGRAGGWAFGDILDAPAAEVDRLASALVEAVADGWQRIQFSEPGRQDDAAEVSALRTEFATNLLRRLDQQPLGALGDALAGRVSSTPPAPEPGSGITRALAGLAPERPRRSTATASFAGRPAAVLREAGNLAAAGALAATGLASRETPAGRMGTALARGATGAPATPGSATGTGAGRGGAEDLGAIARAILAGVAGPPEGSRLVAALAGDPAAGGAKPGTRRQPGRPRTSTGREPGYASTLALVPGAVEVALGATATAVPSSVGGAAAGASAQAATTAAVAATAGAAAAPFPAVASTAPYAFHEASTPGLDAGSAEELADRIAWLLDAESDLRGVER